MTNKIVSRGRLSALRAQKLKMTLSNTPLDYIKDKYGISNEAAEKVNKYLWEKSKLTKSAGLSQVAAARTLGVITDEQFIDTVIAFSSTEIVRWPDIEPLKMTFEDIRLELCKEYCFFAYIGPNPRILYMMIAYDRPDAVSIIKRHFDNANIRFTIPEYIKKRIEEVNADD